MSDQKAVSLDSGSITRIPRRFITATVTMETGVFAGIFDLMLIK
jgi:hypothetical protein